jgi:hypothetical protein
MWNHILIIAVFTLAGLTFFGETSGLLSEYAETAKDEIPRRTVYVMTTLSVGVAALLFYLFSIIWELDTLGLSTNLMFLSILACLWGGFLALRLSERKARVVRFVAYSALLPVLVAGVILSDLLLWQKLVYSLGGIGIGFGLGWLTEYVDVRLKRRRSLQEGDK